MLAEGGRHAFIISFPREGNGTMADESAALPDLS